MYSGFSSLWSVSAISTRCPESTQSSIAWLIDELDNAQSDQYENYTYNLSMVLVQADPILLQPKESAIREATGLRGQVTCRFTHVYPDGPAPYFTFHALGRHGDLSSQWRTNRSLAETPRGSTNFEIVLRRGD